MFHVKRPHSESAEAEDALQGAGCGTGGGVSPSLAAAAASPSAASAELEDRLPLDGWWGSTHSLRLASRLPRRVQPLG